MAALFEDREGNVWAATANGLDRFRAYTASNIGVRQGLSNSNTSSIVVSKDGAIWVGTVNGLNRLKDGQISLAGTAVSVSHSLFQESSGRLWLSTFRQVGYIEANRFVPVLDGWATAMAEAPAGHVWVTEVNQGLFRLSNGKVVDKIPWTKLGHQDNARTVVADPSRRGVWLGFAQGGVAYVEDGAVRTSYSAADGLGAGRVNGLRFDASGALWASTQGGLSRIRDGRITTLKGRNGLPWETVHWTVEDHAGALWTLLSCGLAQIGRAEVEAWAADPARPVKLRLFDESDGVRSHAYPPEPHSVDQSADGRIWFASADGVSVVDPRRLAHNNLPPPVHIEQFFVDGKRHDPTRGLRMPPLVRNLAFSFVAVSLVAPEKNRYRFKLDGWDSAWRDADHELRVEYTNLPPRTYRFHVIACNNSGVWNESGAALEFSIAPAFHQRVWFYPACAAVLLIIVWGLHRARVYQIAREFEAQLDGRVEERLRVARDLHDTLLQTFQAAVIRMHAAYTMFSRRPERALETLEDAIATSAAAIEEGRDAIQNMRSSAVATNDLARALRAAGEQMAAQGSTRFELTVEGAPRDVHPILRDEVYRFALEALRNAFHHAEASGRGRDSARGWAAGADPR